MKSEFSNGATRNVQHYDGILEGLQKNIPAPVHIAGGAVRDTILGQPIRDIDIFLPDAHGDTAAAMLRSQFGYVNFSRATVL